eukprot:CAMPEP_0203810184 /NCGR_PEP_ID=MMETSP0115-20131106/2790_1 /ASSEMBLY_ACC=CAM_ASM_000227 /TAXON_ID=33651 /ORGANISM="Bicosoecid sp, Strain ms1" /LENGTH=180 /DNA_ID=CAMNT_0050718969 /DNA_START=1 /DNA_END=540 /DNA_ORIENTATION=-
MRVATPTLLSATPREALSLAVFLRESMTTLGRWASDRRVYDRECKSRPGFAQKISSPDASRFTFDEFQSIHTKWQSKMASVFAKCFSSAEYVNVKNALVVCKELVSVFPTSRLIAKGLLKAVRIARDRDGVEQDLKTLAGGYYALLEMRIKKLPGDGKGDDRAAGGAGGGPKAQKRKADA